MIYTIEQIAKACLVARLFEKHRSDFSVTNSAYETYDGTRLPPPKAKDGIDLLFHYLHSGSEKVREEAIMKYFQKNLSSENQIKTFLDLDQKIETKTPIDVGDGRPAIILSTKTV